MTTLHTLRRLAHWTQTVGWYAGTDLGPIISLEVGYRAARVLLNEETLADIISQAFTAQRLSRAALASAIKFSAVGGT